MVSFPGKQVTGTHFFDFHNELFSNKSPLFVSLTFIRWPGWTSPTCQWGGIPQITWAGAFPFFFNYQFAFCTRPHVPGLLFKAPLVVLRSFLFQVLPSEPDPEGKTWDIGCFRVRRTGSVACQLNQDKTSILNYKCSDRIRQMHRKGP